MRIPKPRLRQVFEHSTHFKVVSPGGKTITIAKKPLSQGMLGRLRRYAQGGEVQKFEEGGEVLPADIARQPDVDAAMAATPVAQPVEEEAAVPLTGRRAVRATEATGVPQTAEQQAAADLERLRQEAARQAATPAPAPVTPPPVINVNVAAPTAPVAPAAPPPAVKSEAKKPAEVAAPKAEAPAPAEEAAPAPAPAPVASRRPVPIIEERLAPAPVDVTPAPPVTITSQETVGPLAPVAPASVPMGRFLAQPGLLAPPLAAPTLAQTPVPAAPVAVPVAPAAAVAAPVPTAPTPAPAPVLRPLTAEQLVDVAKKLPPATPIKDVVASILGTSPEIAAVALPDVANAPVFSLLRQDNPKLQEAFISAAVDGANALKAQGEAEQAAQAATLDAVRMKELALAEQAKKDEETRRDIRSHIDSYRKDAEAADDLKSFLGGEGSSQGLAKSIFSIASLVVGGFLSGYANTPNYALTAFNNAMERDLEEQKRKRDSKWSRYKDALKSAEAADELVRMDNKALLQVALDKIASTQDLGKIGPKVRLLQSQIERQLALDLERLTATISKEEYLEMLGKAAQTRASRPTVVRAPAAPKPVVDKGPSFAQTKWETGRVFAVDDVPVKASSDTGMKAVRDEVARRNFAVKSLEEAAKDLESLKPGETINVLSPDRQRALSSLALQIENFPQAFGYNRAVSKVAKEQLKEAIANPFGFVAFLKEFIGDVPPATGIRRLVEETVRARDEYIMEHAQADSAREQDAAKYGLWKLKTKEAKLVGRALPAMPTLKFAPAELELPASAAAPTVPAPAVAPSSPATSNIRSRMRELP